MKTAFLGLGIMGSRMAANLVKAGYRLTVWNRTPGKAGDLLAAGAVEAASPAEAASDADVLFTMLSTPQAVESAALGSSGFLPAMKSGSLWVDSSTVNPSFTRRMAAEAAAHRVRFLDAPVAGSKAPAANGQLVFYVGGAVADLDEVRPLLEKMGRAMHHIGENGMGSSFKIINNMLTGQALLAFAETLALGQALGIQRERMLDIFVGGPLVAPLVTGKRAKIETGIYDPEFPLQWMQKDLQLASQTAYEVGLPLPLVNLAKEVYMQAVQAGLGEDDFSAVYEIVNRKAR